MSYIVRYCHCLPQVRQRQVTPEHNVHVTLTRAQCSCDSHQSTMFMWLPPEHNLHVTPTRAQSSCDSHQAPDYIEQCVSRRQPVRSLRSSEHSLLCVPRTRRHWGDRAFSVAAPSLWNALPQHLTLSSMTTAAFKVKLKTHLFTRTFCTALWATTVGTALYKCDDYDYYDYLSTMFMTLTSEQSPWVSPEDNVNVTLTWAQC